jgi:ribosomal protein L11 methyltransferase
MPVVRVVVAEDDAELAADALWAAGPSAVAEESVADGRVQLTADVADPDAVDPRWAPQVLDVDEDADLDAWRAHARPEAAGDRFVLVPSWLPGEPGDPERTPVHLDPGRTFGSGSHPTTRRCVAALEHVVTAGARVADLGCGSGVLSIVAALLGADAVTAVDIDPAAVEATTANAHRNLVGDRVDATTTRIEDLVGPFDVVVANIGLRVLTESAAAIGALVAPDGRLVLAGILDDQVERCLDAHPTLHLVDRIDEDGWAVVTLGRRTSRT